MFHIPTSAYVLAIAGLLALTGCQTARMRQANHLPIASNQNQVSNAAVAQSGLVQKVNHQEVIEGDYLGSSPQFAMGPSGPASELKKVVLPAYRIEPPDILTIEAVQVVPREPYGLRTGDIIAIYVPDAFEQAPIAGTFPVGLGGLVNLGAPYGAVKISGLTIKETRAKLIEHLSDHLKAESLEIVTVSLVETVGKQQIQGQHLVGPDGRVTLGAYGSVTVVGLTIEEAKAAIEQHLTAQLDEPEVAVDVFTYNSKSYYIVTQGGGFGDQVVRVPFTGNETILDALSQVNGLNQVSSKRIWIARPGFNECGQVQVLPVDYDAVTKWADTRTNYQVLPGDRIFIAEDHRVALDTNLGKSLAPIERLFGFSILGVNTVTRFSGNVLGGGGNPGGFGGAGR